jgi:hypothetical protein
MNPVLELALDHPANFAGLVLTIACLACALLFCASLSLQEWQDGRHTRHGVRAFVHGSAATARATEP